MSQNLEDIKILCPDCRGEQLRVVCTTCQGLGLVAYTSAVITLDEISVITQETAYRKLVPTRLS